MELIRKNREVWDPFDMLSDLQTDINRVFNRSAVRGSQGWDVPFQPNIEVREEADHFVVHADLPGLKREDISISVEGNLLTIKGERKREKEAREKGYHYSERAYGAFVRTMELPTEVQADKAKAAYANGVLELSVPKSETARPKQIQIDVK